jgi:cell division protein FtsN
MSTPERRHLQRTTLERLAYIDIEPNNGGIVLNVSSEGLCFHSIAAVEKNGPLCFSLLEQNRRIAACGELAWTDEVQKIGGVRFTTLTAETREQVLNWISQPATPREEHTASTSGSAVLKAFPRPHVRRPDAIPDSANPSGFATALRRMRVRIRLSGFARGLATGLLLSALSASVFLLFAHRRDMGELLIHLGERLAGERPTGEPPAAKPNAEKQPAVLGSEMVSSLKQAPSQAHAPTPMPRILTPMPAPVRVGTSLVSPAEPPVATLRSQLSANVVSNADGDPATHPVVRGTSETSAPPPTTALLGMNSSPAPSIIPNKLATPRQPEPAGAVQVHGVAEANAVSLPQMYFELGKFKDEPRAREVGDKMAQLGLRESIVQKGHLWMSAFYVLVGPYSNEEEATRAHKNLLSHGYKPRPFERGSRNFTFISGLTLAGTRLPVGDFTINWESYVIEAKVKFVQGNDVLATADGQWVKRPARYQRDECVYVKTGNGSRLLREIHFSGLDRALVFRDSS